MQIAEMRSFVETENASKGLPSLPDTVPDWVIRGIYERRNGLDVTSVEEAEVKKMAEILRGYRKQQALTIAQTHKDLTARRDRLRVAVATLY